MTEPIRILLVEDDEVDRLAVRRLVKRQALNWALQEATNCAEAEALLGAGARFDLLLLDHQLPDGTGRELQGRVATNGATPCVFLTGSTSIEIAVEAMRAGALDFVVKDESARYVKLLPTVVQGALDKHRAARELESYRKDLETLVDQRTAELRSALDFNTAALDALADTFFVFEAASQRALHWNVSFREVSGYDNTEIAALPALEGYYRDETLARAEDMQEQALSRGRSTAELELTTKAGETITFEYSVSRVRGPQGEYPCLAMIGRDVTERRELNARLAQADRLASVGLLAAGVAHEINNPLTYLLHELQRLGQSLEGKELERAERALHGAQRVRRIVADLKTFSRAEEDRWEPVDIHGVLDSTIAIAKNEIKHRATLRRDYAPVLPELWGNDSKLAQVFLNLLINAAQAIGDGDPAEDEIRVSTVGVDGGLRVRIEDTGGGIDPALLPKLFDPFITTKDVAQGSGLGLFICHAIVKGHGGTIEIGNIRSGVRVDIRLPADGGPLQDATTATPPTPPDAPPSSQARLLVVDDEPQIRRILEFMLREHGHEVLCLANGGEAQELLGTDQRFDAIFCDLMMPGITGVDLHRWLEDEHPALAERMILITGGAFTPRAQALLAETKSPIIDKPFNAKAVAAALAQILAS